MSGAAIQEAIDEIPGQPLDSVDDQTPPGEMDVQAVSPRQRLALEAFCRGGTMGDAANAANVSRQTLHRWRAKYPHFAMAMSSWSTACVAIAESQMEELAGRAMGAMSLAIDKGDARAAMAVLRSLGILRTYQPSKAPAANAEKSVAMPGMDLLAQVLAESRKGGDEDPPVANSGSRAANQGVFIVPGNSAAGVADAGRSLKTGGTAVSARGYRDEIHRHGNSSTTAQPGVREARTSSEAAGVLRREDVTSEPKRGRKTAILDGKAGLAIKRACDGALQNATECYQMLPDGAEQNASLREVSFASCA